MQLDMKALQDDVEEEKAEKETQWSNIELNGF